jgi:hypothetical protein
MPNNPEQKYIVTIEYHGTTFERPWIVDKQSIKPEVIGSGNDMYATPQEAITEAVRFLASSLKLRRLPKPGDSPIFKDVIDWWKCAECMRNTCDGCDNIKQS